MRRFAPSTAPLRHSGARVRLFVAPLPARRHYSTSPKPPSGSNSGANGAAKLKAALDERMSEIGPKVLARVQGALGRWNEVSGYEEVEKLKLGVTEAEERLATLRSSQQEALACHRSAIAARSQTQRALNDLLTRKASWTAQDLTSYTTLLQSEHSEAALEREAAEAYEAAERQREKAWDEVVRKTLERYHEEWRWSERGKAMGTWVGAGVVGLNVLLFVTAILLVEPYKRRKLAETFEARLLQGEAVGQALLQGTMEKFEARVASIEERLVGVDHGVGNLCAIAGIGAVASGEGQDGTTAADGERESVETISHMSTEEAMALAAVERKRKQKDLALAASVGFALGAGLLATVSASWSG